MADTQFLSRSELVEVSITAIGNTHAKYLITLPANLDEQLG
jgi:hypothetical protein